MSAVTITQSSPVVAPTPLEITERLIDELEDKVHLARVAFTGLRSNHDAHLVGDQQANAIIGLLDEIAERTHDVLCAAQRARIDSGDSILSTMAVILRLVSAEEIDNEWIRGAKNMLAILNYVAGGEGAHNPAVGELADLWQAHIEGRGVKIEEAVLESYRQMRT